MADWEIVRTFAALNLINNSFSPTAARLSRLNMVIMFAKEPQAPKKSVNDFVELAEEMGFTIGDAFRRHKFIRYESIGVDTESCYTSIEACKVLEFEDVINALLASRFTGDGCVINYRSFDTNGYGKGFEPYADEFITVEEPDGEITLLYSLFDM